MTGCLCLVIMYSVCEYYDIYLTFGQCIGNALNYQGTSYFFICIFLKKYAIIFQKLSFSIVCVEVCKHNVYGYSVCQQQLQHVLHRDGVEGIQWNMPYAFCILFVALAGVYTLHLQCIPFVCLFL